MNKKIRKGSIWKAGPGLLKPKKSIGKYVVIGLVIGIAVAVAYYFVDYQDTLKIESNLEAKAGICGKAPTSTHCLMIENNEISEVSKDVILLADDKSYELDVVLNSIVNNQFVLQELIRVMNERIDLIIKEREQENATNNNQGE